VKSSLSAVVVLLLCSVSGFCQYEYTVQGLDAASRNLKDDSSKIELYKNFMLNAQSMGTVCHTCMVWEDLDRDALDSFVQQQYAAAPDSAKWMYLYARFFADRVEQARIGHELLKRDSESAAGYELVLYKYYFGLFCGRAQGKLRDSLIAELPADEPLMERYTKAEGTASGAIPRRQMLAYLLAYRGKGDSALAVMKTVHGLDNSFTGAEYAGVYAWLGQYDKAYQSISEAFNRVIWKDERDMCKIDVPFFPFCTSALRILGSYYQSSTESLIRDFYLGALGSVGAYGEAIRYFRNLPNFKETDTTLSTLACWYALADNPDSAFALLDRATSHGLDALRFLSTDKNLSSLRDDPRWKEFMKKVQANRELGREARRIRALAAVSPDSVPDWCWIDTNGIETRLKDLPEKPVILCFLQAWATNPIVLEQIDEMAQDTAFSQMRTIVVEVPGPSIANTRRSYRKRGLHAGVLLTSGALKPGYGIDFDSLPYFVLLDQTGHPRFRASIAPEDVLDYLTIWLSELTKK
jgi:tetratricopeptide (TPR) repeat protein